MKNTRGCCHWTTKIDIGTRDAAAAAAADLGGNVISQARIRQSFHHRHENASHNNVYWAKASPVAY